MEIKFNKENLKVVNINEVRPNSWNPKLKGTDDFEKVKMSLQKNGQMKPIVVRENNGFEIIDGEQRYTAMSELGFESVLVYSEGEVNDERAKELTIWYQQQVPFDKVDEAHLVNSIKDIIGQLPYTPNELKDLQNIVEFDWNNYQVDFELEERDSKAKLTIRTEHFEEVKKYAESLMENVRVDENDKTLKELNIVKIKKINVLSSQAKIINEALERMKEQGIKPDGRALELICADFLGGLEQNG